MTPEEHTENIIVTISKAELEAAVRAAWPWLTGWKLDDADLLNGDPDAYVRLIYTKPLPLP